MVVTRGTKELLRALITLACEDGEFHPKEEQFVKRIAQANQVDDAVINELIADKTPLTNDYSMLSYEERFETLYSLLIMMKADNVVMDQEVVFIQKMATHLGFHLSAVMELYPHVHTNVRDPHTYKMMRNTLRNHLLTAKNDTSS